MQAVIMYIIDDARPIGAALQAEWPRHSRMWIFEAGPGLKARGCAFILVTAWFPKQLRSAAQCHHSRLEFQCICPRDLVNSKAMLRCPPRRHRLHDNEQQGSGSRRAGEEQEQGRSRAGAAAEMEEDINYKRRVAAAPNTVSSASGMTMMQSQGGGGHASSSSHPRACPWKLPNRKGMLSDADDKVNARRHCVSAQAGKVSLCWWRMV